jgi:hypothetical protein
MAGPPPDTLRKERGTDRPATAKDRGTDRRDVRIDTGLGTAVVAAVVLDKPPRPFHEQLDAWIPSDVRAEIRGLETAGQFTRKALLETPRGRFLKRYPHQDGAVVIWIGIAQNVELHAYREFPEAYSHYLVLAEGDEDTARLLHETYTQYNRDLWHLVDEVGWRPDFGRALLQSIDDEVFKLVLEGVSRLLNAGASIGAIKASMKKVLDSKRVSRGSRGGLKPKKPGGPADKPTVPPVRKRITAEEEALLRKGIGDQDYDDHLKALEDIRNLNRNLDNLTDAEIVAIRAYAHNTYDAINRALRHGGITPELKLVIDSIISGLKKLAPAKGTFDRGIALGSKDAESLFIEGKLYIDKAFQSSTAGAVPMDTTIVLTIKAVGKAGRDISKIAAHDEAEVLFPPNTRFRVEKVTRVGGDIRFVELTEL